MTFLSKFLFGFSKKDIDHLNDRLDRQLRFIDAIEARLWEIESKFDSTNDLPEDELTDG